MNKQNESPELSEQNRWLRPAWIVLTVIFAVLLLISLFRWNQGKSSIENALVPIALLLLGLVQTLSIKGALRIVLLVLGIVLAGLAVILNGMEILFH